MQVQDTMDQIVRAVATYVPNLIGALAILIIGWLIALIVSAIVRGVLQRTKWTDKLSSAFGAEEEEKTQDVARGIGKGIFWLIMVLVLIAFLQALRLTLVTDPLNRFMNQIFQFLPQLIGAGILLLIAWIIATVLRMVIMRVMGAAKLDERLGSKVDAEDGDAIPLTKTIGDVVYWLIFLLFLPAILGSLNLGGLLSPVQNMLEKFLAFFPNVLAAGVIGVVGWFVARIVRQVVTGLLSATGADKISDRIGLTPLSRTIGLVVYILILIPVLIASLNALALDAITQPASSMLNLILGAMPSIFAALVVVMIAYMVGRMLSGFVTELMTGIGFNSILVRLGIGREPEEGKQTPSQMAGRLVLVAIMLFAIFEASNLLGFQALSDITAELTVFGGRILLGVIILGIGLYLANLASKAVQSTGKAQAGLLAIVARVAIILLSGSIAIRHMGLANDIINLAFGLILGAIAIASAIAFGIGGRNIAARKLEEWTGHSESQ